MPTLGPKTRARIRQAVETVEQWALPALGGQRRVAQESRPILAQLTEWERANNQCHYHYAFEEVVLTPNAETEVKPGGITGTTTDNFAINLRELNNTGAVTPANPLAWQANGVRVTGGSVPPKFYFQPVGGGRTSDAQTSGTIDSLAPVELWPRYANDGTTRFWLFTAANGYDGDCE